MIRVHESKSASAAVKYLENGLEKSDYLSEGQKVEAEWLGKGSARLGLQGKVGTKDMAALMENRNPKTGKKLTPRDKKNRRAGYDVTVSAWKSASVMSEVMGCLEVRDAFVRSADAMMTQKAEPEICTRVRVDGQDCDGVTSEMVCGRYLHLEARPVDGKPDAHVHGHYYVVNATWDGTEDRWKAAQLGRFKATAPDMELDFDARYGKMLLDMGYVPAIGKSGVQIKGVPQSVLDKFSRSSKRIDKEAAMQGVTDGIGKHKIADKLRERKQKGMSRQKLEEEWLSRLTDDECAALEKVKNKQIERGPEINARQATDYAIEHLFQREDVITERKLRKTAVHYGIGYLMPEDVNKEIAAALERGDIQAKEGKKGRNFVKTSALRDQCRIVQWAQDGRGQYEPLSEKYQPLTELSEEQNAVARGIVEGRDKYVGFRGPAGTGKSYSLKGVDAAIQARASAGEERFSRALALAPSSSASRGELRKAGFKDATTLAAFFESEKLQAQMRGQFLIVDEAGMMSTKDMVRLMSIAGKNDSRVLFVGDYRQHASVDAGDAFRLLQAEGGIKYSELTENRRQKKAVHRDAVNTMATGTKDGILKGFDMLDRAGAVVVEADREKLRQKLTAAYLKSADEGRTGLIITPTHAEADYLAAELRGALKESGAIVGEEREFVKRVPTQWTDAQKRDSRNYERGMIVTFHKAIPGERHSVKGKRETTGGFRQGETGIVLEGGNEVTLGRLDGTVSALPAEHAERFEVYRTGKERLARGDRIRITKNGRLQVNGQGVGTAVNNGDIFTVDGFTKDGDIRLSGGKLMPKNYGHIALGYTATSQRSQGATVDDVFVDWQAGALTPVNRQAAYVTSSRFRENISIFVSDKKAAKEAMVRGGERLSALELMKDDIGVEKVTVEKRFGLHKHMELNRVRAYLRKPMDAAREAARYLADKWRGRGGLSHG